MIDIFRTILEISAFAGIMVIVVLAIKAIIGSRVQLKILNILWAVILIRLLFPITIESPVHLDEIRFSKSQEVIVDRQTEAADLSFLDNLVTTTTSVPIEQIVLQEGEIASTEQILNESVNDAQPTWIQKTVSTLKSFSIMHYLMLTWLMGIVCLIGFVAAKYIKFNRSLKAYSVKAPKEITALCNRLCKKIGVSQDIQVVFSKLVSTPITFKAFKPLIIMPYSLIGKLSKQKFELIMLHEISHIKRKDIAINMLWMVAKIMHWFNPLVWVAYKSYVDDMELACDEMVTSYLTTKQSYAYSQSLIDVIRFSKKEAKLPMVLSFCEDKAKLKRRVENMLKPKRKLKVVSAVCILIVVVMLVGGFTTACLPSEGEVIDEYKQGGAIDVVDNESANKIINTSSDSEDIDEIVLTKLSSEQAIDIAKNNFITWAEDYKYVGFNIKDDIIIHEVAADNYMTKYLIYDFDGSIQQASSELVLSESYIEDEAHAKEMAEVIVDDTWGEGEIKFISYNDFNRNNIILYGTLENNESLTSFTIVLNDKAQIKLMQRYQLSDNVLKKSQLPAKYYKEKQKVLEAVKKYKITDAQDFTYECTGTDGVIQMHMVNSDEGQSDYFLDTYLNKIVYAKTNIYPRLEELEFNRQSYEEMALNYAQDMWGEAVRKVSVYESDQGFVMVYLDEQGLESPDGRDILVMIDGKGRLLNIKLQMSNIYSVEEISNEGIQEVNKGLNVPILIDLEKIARDRVFEYCNFAKDEDVELVRTYDSSGEPMTIYEFKYHAKEPSISDYSFIATMGIRDDGSFGKSGVQPIVEELDIIDRQEAIAKAKDYITERIRGMDGFDVDKLKHKEDYYLTGFAILIHQINFEYNDGEQSYFITMAPNDGEIDGFGQ